MRLLPLVLLLLSCGSPAVVDPTAACRAEGGTCVLGGTTCNGVRGQTDCNPNRNPGGASCCIPR